MSIHPTDLPAGFDAECPASYRALGAGRYAPSRHVQGAWRPDEQHMAPVAGLLTHALLIQAPRDDVSLSRISFDILGQIPAGVGQIEVEVVRPGRTIELLEARLEIAGRPIVVARAWRLRTGDTAGAAAIHDQPLPGPEDTPPWDGMRRWSGGLIESLEFRAGPDAAPGRGHVWLRSTVPLVEGEPVSELATVLALVDCANGCLPVADPTAWLFPNVDLNVHLLRPPTGEWLGLDITASVGRTGLGVTSAVLHDVDGPFGRSEQGLTVRPMPGLDKTDQPSGRD